MDYYSHSHIIWEHLVSNSGACICQPIVWNLKNIFENVLLDLCYKSVIQSRSYIEKDKHLEKASDFKKAKIGFHQDSSNR